MCIGFICALIIGVIAFTVKENGVLILCLALFIYYTCRQQWILLETGGEDSPFGYDFSQGYTSLERGFRPFLRCRRVASTSVQHRKIVLDFAVSP